MMQPMDPLSQLAMCCGLGNRRREFKHQPRNYFYSPSTAAHLNRHESSWALANPYGPQQIAAGPAHAPYLLLTQPVIITANPGIGGGGGGGVAGLNQTNTMTLVQHAQTATQNGAAFPGGFSILTSSPQHHHQLMQPNIVSSQYAIYNTAASLQPGAGFTPMAAISEPPPPPREQLPANNIGGNSMLDPACGVGGQNIYSCANRMSSHQVGGGGAAATAAALNRTPIHQLGSSERKVATLSSDVFRQLDMIEKQVDLSRDMETVEKYGIVITRALDPYSLMPHLSESTLRDYNERYLLNDSYVVRFIEIIKRPGQTLGLYIRTIRFEDSQGRGSRVGVVITKIDTDSPIFNSPILHVGDEIISVNLVAVDGMSLDNLVVIMSIPKRLVLALRVPRDRDRLLSMDLMQQQHRALRESMLEQRGTAAAAQSSSYIDRPVRPQSASFEEHQYHLENMQRTYDTHPATTEQVKQPLVTSNIRLGDTPEQSSYFSSSIDAINRELKELRRQRMALSNNEQTLDSAIFPSDLKNL